MVSEEQLKAILDQFVPPEFHTDFEMRAIAYMAASLDAPVNPPEHRFFEAETILPGDSPEDGDYTVRTSSLILENCESRFWRRLQELEEY
ncbi:hypothetical protein GCM10009715_41990 [Paeniglutamicibacter psychrophenolicus]|uniref:Uncharacterized protein n=1 Tax=Paeniglutamicibacter psychrophenolicus TaxID=257454 RepID=A0ABS4WKF5_9MICC|nr:hypothetical protein [Paeniglutamicibacter psychrophenolicus]MBP2376463.1 hypothetical protein [Paeniglutamicibacter psychrophenolicus]